LNQSQSRLVVILASIYIANLVFLFLPSEIYQRNPLEFISTPGQLIIDLALYAVLAALILLAPVFIPGRNWRRIYSAGLGGLFFALWVSGVFLLVDFGLLDGTSFDLEEHSKTLSVHDIGFLLIWAMAFVGFWKWHNYLLPGMIFIGTGLFIIGMVNFNSAEGKNGRKWEAPNLAEIARFSSQENLFIVLMDTFQSDVLEELLSQDPDLANQFDGFTFYPDTLGIAPSTYLTMPAFHSGKEYNGIMALSEFYDVGVREGSFFSELANSGYQVDIINPIASACPEGARNCLHQENLLLEVDAVTETEASRLADLSFLRVAPGRSKMLVFDGSSGPVTRLRNEVPLSGLAQRIYQGNTIQELIADNMNVDDGAPTAKLVHLFNTHPPYMFDEFCQFQGVSKTSDRPQMTAQVHCSTRRFLSLMQTMKDQSVYDNSLIILMADTGAGSVHGADDLSSLYAQRSGLEPGELGRLIGGANPVLAIKYPGDSGPLRESALSAQLTDIAQTVCSSLQGCKHIGGLDLRTASPEPRKRMYNYYAFKNEYWGMDHIPGVIQYQVNGPLWLENSWSRWFSDSIPKQIAKLSFSDEDDAEFFGMGWSRVETNKKGVSKRWSTSIRSELFLPLPVDSETNLTLEFKVLSAPDIENQSITIQVNGVELASRKLDHRVQNVTFEVPSSAIKENITPVVLQFGALRKSEKPNGRDLSVSFFELNIRQIPSAEPKGN
jgi:hypothetical protein